MTDFTNSPDDGHLHEWEFAEGVETGTDADPYVCKKCGQSTTFDHDDRFDD